MAKSQAVQSALDQILLIGRVLRSLDMALLEWKDDLYTPLASPPRWFSGKVPWASLPFLEHFVDEARRYLHDHVGGVIASDQFSVQGKDEELLLRARALRVQGKLVLAIERLVGASDVRPILRQAREQALEHEALADQSRAVHAPVAAMARAVEQLKVGSLSKDQRAAVDALSGSIATLQEIAASLPSPRKRRP
jgi:hypothetical protein